MQKNLSNWNKDTYSERLLQNCQSILEEGLVPRGKEKDKAREAVFLTPTNPFGNGLVEEEPRDYFAVRPKAFYVANEKDNQNAVHWERSSKAKDQRLDFQQTKSFAIMACATILGDCIDRETCQNGERVDFES